MSRNKVKDQRNNRRRIQTGRSLLEMIMVVCVMILFSIGGYAVYCSAIRGYKANKAIDEIQNIAEAIKENSSYGKNYFGYDLKAYYSAVVRNHRVYVVSYPVPSERMCQRILLSKLSDEFQNEIEGIVVFAEADAADSDSLEFKWIGEDYPYSSTVQNALKACALGKGEAPITLQYTFR